MAGKLFNDMLDMLSHIICKFVLHLKKSVTINGVQYDPHLTSLCDLPKFRDVSLYYIVKQYVLAMEPNKK